MQNLYTNRNSEGDFIRNGLSEFLEDDMDIFIASAFFTEFNVVKMFIESGCHIRIIVRLGFPTSPLALEKLLNNSNIEARFYTSHSFHPKIYIFGDKSILVGSANLTNAAILTNQEVVVALPSEDERFDGIIHLFSQYWNESEVLTEEAVSKYSSIYQKYKQASQLVRKLDNEVISEIGDKNFSNINRGKKKVSKKSIFLSSYSKSYQESVSAYKKIESEYKSKNRKIDEQNIPLRLEIDSFFGFVRDRHASKDIWKQQQIGWNNLHKTNLNTLIDEWLSITWDYFEDEIVNQNYPLIKEVFGSKESINKSSGSEIVNALCVLHSFHDRLRFCKGGLETLKAKFLEKNELNNIKKTLVYLLYGNDEVVLRMSNCLYSSQYKLNEFGQANVQELIGWLSKESLPVINGRTTKVLRYFGFDIRQL